MATLSMLINGLHGHVLQRFPGSSEYYSYQGIYLVDDATVCESGMVYVGEAECMLRLLLRGNLPMDCVLFAAKGDEERLCNAPRHDVPLILTDLPLIGLYNALFRTLSQCSGWRTKLLSESHNSLRTLLTTATRELSFSVRLLSNSLQHLGQSVLEGEDELLALAQENPEQNSQALLEGLLQQLQANASGPEIVTTQRKDGYIYAVLPVRQRGTALGFLFACTKGRNSMLHNMLLVLAEAVKELMLRAQEESGETDSFQLLAANFLGDAPDDLDKLDIRLRQLTKRPKRFIRSLVIRQLGEDGHPLPVLPKVLQTIYSEVKQMFPNDNVAILPDCIYVMLSDAVPNAPIPVAEDAEFSRLLERHHAYAMVTNPSQWLRGVRVLYLQAHQLLPAAVAVRYQKERERRCLRFDRYAPYYAIHLCEKAARKAMGVGDILYLCHTSVLTLTRYDRAFNSNLRDVLFTFLMNDRSISETSRQLYMHRNTTIYKLNKIQELTGDDLTNPYTRHQMVFSCMIIRYVEEYLHQNVDLPPLENNLLRK